MQLGKALLGAIIGACVGIVALLAVYLTTGHDRVWLSIPFALITGLGVRMLASTTGHASYVRGALTMVIALAAYIGGWLLVPQVIAARANAANAKSSAVSGEKPSSAEPGDTEAKDADGEDSQASDENKDADATDKKKDAEAAPKAAPPKLARAATPRGVPYTPWDIICLAIAALVAYEMGRGSGTFSSAGPSIPSTSVGTHPDA